MCLETKERFGMPRSVGQPGALRSLMWRLLVSSTTAVAIIVLGACRKDPQIAKLEYARSGDAYFAQGKFAEAAIQFRNAIKLDPRWQEVRSKLGETCLKTGDFVGAYEEFIRAADLGPTDVEAQIKAGGMLLLARKFGDAAARADKALAVDPRAVDALILRANALAGLNRIDDAIAEVEEAIRTDPSRGASYTNLGNMRMLRGDRGNAEAAFRQAVRAAPKSVDTHLALANFLWACGRQSEAEVELKAGVNADPKSLVANRALAVFDATTGRSADAEGSFKAVALLSPDSAGKLALADYYTSQQRREEAASILRTVAAEDPKAYASATLRLAVLGLLDKDQGRANALVDQVLQKDPRNVDALIAKAQLQADVGNLTLALASAQQAVATDPRSGSAQFSLGRVLALEQEDDGASKAFAECLRLNPRLAVADVELAKLNLRAGKLAAAKQFAESALAQVSGYVDAQLLLARINVLQGNTEEADKPLRALAAALPESPVVQTQLARLELREGRRSAARSGFEKVLRGQKEYAEALSGLIAMDLQDKKTSDARARVDALVSSGTKDPTLLLLAGRAYFAVGANSLAEGALKKAIQIEPTLLEGYQALGQLFVSQHRLDEAQREFEQVAAHQPRSVAVRTLIGMLQEMRNQPAEARATYQQVLSIDSHAPVAANNLACLYAKQGGNLDIALQLAQTAKAGLPNSYEVNDTLGWIYAMKGLSSLAIPPLLAAIRDAPSVPSYYFHLGMAYAGAGDRTKARAAFEKALELDPSFDEAAQARRELARLVS